MSSDPIHHQPAGAVGWLYYDGSCGLCRSARSRWERVFRRRGFVWLPLQTPGTAELLGVSEEELRREIKLRLPDGRVLGGMDAVRFLMRSLWWLWLPGVLAGAPGIRCLAAAVYRQVARNRQRLSAVCRLPG